MSLIQHPFTKLAIQSEIKRFTGTLPISKRQDDNIVRLDCHQREESIEDEASEFTNDTCNGTLNCEQQTNDDDLLVVNEPSAKIRPEEGSNFGAMLQQEERPAEIAFVSE